MTDPLLYITEQRSREVGFLDESTYKAFNNTLIAIAGLGSVGSDTAVALTKAGFKVTIGDPDVVSLSNIARQYYLYNQIGENKATALQANLKAIHPFLEVTAFPEGLTQENIEAFLGSAHIIFDGIDLKELDRIYELHEYAANNGIPVIMGLDLAGTGLVRTFRYDKKKSLAPLGGAYSEQDIAEFVSKKQMLQDGTMSEPKFIEYIYGLMPRLISIRDVPYEQLYEALSRSANDTQIYQSPHTPLLLGALVVEVARQLSIGKEVKGTIKVDLPTEVRPFLKNLRTFFLKAKIISQVIARYSI